MKIIAIIMLITSVTVQLLLTLSAEHAAAYPEATHELVWLLFFAYWLERVLNNG